MAISIQGFNVGTDASFAITDSYGDLFIDDSLGYLMEFESQSQDVDLKIVPINNGGIPVYQTLWSGVQGTLMITRVGPSFQQLFMDLMNGYYIAGLIPQFSLALNVRNRDGTVDEYLYSGFQWVRPRFGNFRGTKEVDMQADFHASLVQATGSLTTIIPNLLALI